MTKGVGPSYALPNAALITLIAAVLNTGNYTLNKWYGGNSSSGSLFVELTKTKSRKGRYFGNHSSGNRNSKDGRRNNESDDDNEKLEIDTL